MNLFEPFQLNVRFNLYIFMGHSLVGKNIVYVSMKLEVKLILFPMLPNVSQHFWSVTAYHH